MEALADVANYDAKEHGVVYKYYSATTVGDVLCDLEAARPTLFTSCLSPSLYSPTQFNTREAAAPAPSPLAVPAPPPSASSASLPTAPPHRPPPATPFAAGPSR